MDSIKRRYAGDRRRAAEDGQWYARKAIEAYIDDMEDAALVAAAYEGRRLLPSW